MEEPLPLEETLEYRFWQEAQPTRRWQKAFREEFDASLGGYTSRLISYKADNEAILAQAVREVLGLPRAALSDEEAIALVLDPARNPYFGEALNVTTLSRVPHRGTRRHRAHPHSAQPTSPRPV